MAPSHLYRISNLGLLGEFVETSVIKWIQDDVLLSKLPEAEHRLRMVMEADDQAGGDYIAGVLVP